MVSALFLVPNSSNFGNELGAEKGPKKSVTPFEVVDAVISPHNAVPLGLNEQFSKFLF